MARYHRFLFTCCVIVHILFCVGLCEKITQDLGLLTDEEKSFMTRYGYLPEGDGDGFSYTRQSLSEAIQKMQAFGGVPRTGVLDAQTKQLFKKRRCGVKDIEDTTRKRRFAIVRGWSKKHITYKVVNGSRTLSKESVEEIMDRSVAVWAPHGGLTFERVQDGPADISVTFFNYDHGDGSTFDGPGEVLAHAFPPPSGAMHFDDGELWAASAAAAVTGDSPPDEPDETIDESTDLFTAAVHELGHALGMAHSDVRGSVMYPYYQASVEKLHMDDILGMHELYFKEEPPPEVTEDPTVYSKSTLSHEPRFTRPDVTMPDVTRPDVDDVTPTMDSEEENEVPDLCFTNYDTIQVIQGRIFVFEEEWVWVLDDRKEVEQGFPRRFHEVFVGLPKHITSIRAVYEKQNGNIVIFYGRKYWEFSRDFRLLKTGRLVNYGLPRRVVELSTAFFSNHNNKTYLIDQEQFWRYDEGTGALDRGYPKDMAAWRQVPYPVDAALIWKGDTYFFRGARFWRFDNSLVQAHPYYPLPVAPIWLPCNVTAEDVAVYMRNDEP